MKVLESKRKKNTIHLKVEGTQEELDRSVDKAFTKLVKKANVKGFRKGKVPRNIFEREYGKGVLVQEGIQDLVNVLYGQAVQELDLDIIDYPKNVNIEEYKEGKPVRFTCEVDVKPDIKLGKYKGLKVDHVNEEVSDDAVQKELNYMQDNAGKYELTDQPIEDKDISRANISAKIGDEIVEDWKKDNFGFKVGMNQFGSDFDAHVIGMIKGDTRSFEVSYADDFKIERIAGETVSFDIELLENRSRATPELDDAFAKANSKYETLDELKEGIRQNLAETGEKRNKEALREKVLKAMVETVEVELQDVLVERETENSLRQLDQTLRQSGSDLSKYCDITKKTIDDLKSEFKDGSIQKLKTDLALEAIGVKESFEVSREDLVAEVKQWNVKELDSEEAIDKYIDQVDPKQLESIVRRQKTIDFLIDHAKISSKSK